jgi:hypothetical protein
MLANLASDACCGTAKLGDLHVEMCLGYSAEFWVLFTLL